MVGPDKTVAAAVELLLLQVECELFPLMRNQRLLLSSVNVDEALVQDYMSQAVDIFKANILGPQKYLMLYRKYADLLNGKTDQEITVFLVDPHSIEEFKEVWSRVLQIVIFFLFK